MTLEASCTRSPMVCRASAHRKAYAASTRSNTAARRAGHTASSRAVMDQDSRSPIQSTAPQMINAMPETPSTMPRWLVLHEIGHVVPGPERTFSTVVDMGWTAAAVPEMLAAVVAAMVAKDIFDGVLVVMRSSEVSQRAIDHKDFGKSSSGLCLPYPQSPESKDAEAWQSHMSRKDRLDLTIAPRGQARPMFVLCR